MPRSSLGKTYAQKNEEAIAALQRKVAFQYPFADDFLAHPLQDREVDWSDLLGPGKDLELQLAANKNRHPGKNQRVRKNVDQDAEAKLTLTTMLVSISDPRMQNVLKHMLARAKEDEGENHCADKLSEDVRELVGLAGDDKYGEDHIGILISEKWESALSTDEQKLSEASESFPADSASQREWAGSVGLVGFFDVSKRCKNAVDADPAEKQGHVLVHAAFRPKYVKKLRNFMSVLVRALSRPSPIPQLRNFFAFHRRTAITLWVPDPRVHPMATVIAPTVPPLRKLEGVEKQELDGAEDIVRQLEARLSTDIPQGFETQASSDAIEKLKAHAFLPEYCKRCQKFFACRYDIPQNLFQGKVPNSLVDSFNFINTAVQLQHWPGSL